ESFCELAEQLAPLSPLPGNVDSALVKLATGTDDPLVRVRAAEVQARAVTVNPQATATLVELATTADDPPAQVRPAEPLAHRAPPCPLRRRRGRGPGDPAPPRRRPLGGGRGGRAAGPGRGSHPAGGRDTGRAGHHRRQPTGAGPGGRDAGPGRSNHPAGSGDT